MANKTSPKRAKNSSNSKIQLLTTRKKAFGLVLLSGLFLIAVFVVGFRYSPTRIKARAASTVFDCLYHGPSTNQRFACIAESIELQGIRYGNASINSNNSGLSGPVFYNKFWGISTGSKSTYAKNPQMWWNTDRNSSNDLLDCSGFVNVVFWLGLNQPPIDETQINDVPTDYTVRGAASTYIQMAERRLNPSLRKIVDLTSLLPDLTSLLPGDILIKEPAPGNADWHAEIFTGYGNVKGAVDKNAIISTGSAFMTAEKNIQWENQIPPLYPVSDPLNSLNRTQSRSRPPTKWTYGLRYKYPLPAPPKLIGIPTTI